MPKPAPEEKLAQPSEPEGVTLITVLYSRDRDVYCVPALKGNRWLSVMAYPQPVTQLPTDTLYLGPVVSADQKHWRRSYSREWKAIVPGDCATLPSNDPLVADYAALT